MAEWRFLQGIFGGGNYILKGDGFFISYNPAPGSGFSLFASDGGGSETALCKDGDYWILNGDFRDQYEALVPSGFERCILYFESQKGEFGSSWTDGAAA